VDEALRRQSEAYLDTLFGPGMGARHARFLEHLDSAPLREALHGYHVLEADEARLSVRENYLIGMCVLAAQGRYAVAGMFARTLRHVGVPRETVMEAIARLSMWIGGVPAAEAAGHIQRACDDYDRRGLASLDAWFPSDE
jgi:alkylhydroperoxidase/carboxymuconolactone decarboxylase family protein YurZ